jgi:PKD repeat protein
MNRSVGFLPGRVLRGCLAFFVAWSITTVASAGTVTLRIVTYNIQSDTGTFTTPRPGLIAPSSGGSVTNGGVLEGIGEEILAGNSQPIDILALQETTSNTTTVQPIVNGLNIFYSFRNMPARYAMSTVQATESGGFTGSGNGPNALVYNTNTVQLLASVPVDPPGGISNLGSASGEYREVMRYQFAPAGVTTNSTNTFYVYVSHYKSGTGTTNMGYRDGEAGIIRNNSALLPSDARVLYVGDFNASTSSEPMYQTLVAPGVNQAFDPINPSNANVNWGTSTTDTNILKTLSESATNLRFRDDYHMVTSNVLYGVGAGLALVPGTYHVFGVDGTTPYNGSVISNSNTSLNNLNTNGVGIAAAQLRTNLTTATDHLPVVADYTIPIPGIAPVAIFSGSPTNGTEPLVVTFADTSTGDITNRFWDFGDSGTTNLTTNTVTHTYAAGTNTVALIVSGSNGVGSNTKTNYITVLTAFQSWQVFYFGSTTNAAAASAADPDGDGQNNMAEFSAGTNPTNSASALRITSIATQGTNVVVTWMTAAGKTNALQATGGDPGGGYTTNGFVAIVTVTNTIGTVTNGTDVGGATSVPARYYRVRLVP